MNKFAYISRILLTAILVISPFFANLSPSKAAELLTISNFQDSFMLPDQYREGQLKITWQTNQPSYSILSYGTDRDNLVTSIRASGEPRTEHEVIISTPKKETLYFYQVQVFINAQSVTSFIRSYKTPVFKEKGTLPVQTDFDVIALTGSTAVIHWNTDQETSGHIQFGLEQDKLSWGAGHGDRRTDHEVILKNLKPNTDYFYKVTSKNSDGFESTTYGNRFKTLITNESDSKVVSILNLKPTSINDNGVTANALSISFRTDKPARSTLWIEEEKGGGRQTVSSNKFHYLNHELQVSGLKPDTSYRATLEVIDVNGKVNKRENISFRTATLAPQETKTVTSHAMRHTFTLANRLVKTSDSDTVYAIFDPRSATTVSSKSGGWFARYYDYSKNHPDMHDWSRNVVADNPFGYDWYDDTYLVRTSLDENLNFGGNFYPLDDLDKEGLDHNFIFGAHWTGFTTIEREGNYRFTLTSDDDAWVLVDGKVVANNSGMHGPKKLDGSIFLKNGLNQIDIYFAERHPVVSYMNFNFLDASIKIRPFSGENVGSEGPLQRHAIMNPKAFEQYGYDWDAIEIVNASEIDSIPLTTLVRTPDNPTVYLLNQQRRTKIAIPNEKVFASYNFNWSDVVYVNHEDVQAYYSATLVKSHNAPTVYLVTDTTKRPFIGSDIFLASGYSFQQVISLSEAHLAAYTTGEPIRQSNVTIANQN